MSADDWRLLALAIMTVVGFFAGWTAGLIEGGERVHSHKTVPGTVGIGR